MTSIQQHDSPDTALARLLCDQGSVEYGTLKICLAEVRHRRSTEPEVSLAGLLVQRNLASAEVVNEGLLRIAEDPSLLDETLPEAAPPSEELIQPARLGPYLFVREIARGGMGAVHEVVDEQTDTHYALKTLLPSLLGGAALEELERFRREAEVMGRLRHPNVARIHAAVLDGPTPYLVQDLLSGGNLHERILSGSMDVSEALEITLRLARGLEHSHESGVLHRDLKPKNVMFDERGEPQLVDFGLAYVAMSRRLTETGTVLGTPGYMAPEQARGEGKVDARTDVYGLGAVLYTMLTGGPPFKGTGVFGVLAQVINDPPVPPSKSRPDVPEWLESVCLRALAKDPELRQPNMRAFAEALEARKGEGGRRSLSSRSLVKAGVALIGVVALTAVALATWPSPAAAPTPSALPHSPTPNRALDPDPESDSSTPRRLATLAHVGWNTTIRFLPDGRVVSSGKGLRLWSPVDWGSTPLDSSGRVTSIQPLVESKLLALIVASDDSGELVLRSLVDPTQVVGRIPLDFRPDESCALRFRGEQCLLLNNPGGEPRLVPLEVTAATAITSLGVRHVNAIRASADGQSVLVLAGSERGLSGTRGLARLELWNTSGSVPVMRRSVSVSSRPNVATPRAEGGWLVGLKSGEVLLYDSKLSQLGDAWVPQPYPAGTDRAVLGGGWPVKLLHILRDGRLLIGAGGPSSAEPGGVTILRPAGEGWNQAIGLGLASPAGRHIRSQLVVSADETRVAFVVEDEEAGRSRVEVWSLPPLGE